MGNRHEDDLHPCAWRTASRLLHKSVTCPNAQSQCQRRCTGRRQFTVLETLHGVRDTSLLRPSLLQRADQQVNDLTQAPCPDDTQRCQRHPVSEDTQRCQRHRTPSGSGPVVLDPSLARSCLAVGWRLFVCGGGCRPFGVSVARVALLGAFPRGLFLVLALSCFSAFVVRVQFSLSELNGAGSMDQKSLVHPGLKWFSPVSWVVRSGRLSLTVSGGWGSEGPDAFPDNVMDYHTPWMRSDRLNLPTDTESFRRSRRIPGPRDGFISARDEAKHHCQRQTRLGRSLRIPKHRDGCPTVNMVRSSRPSLTTRGETWKVPAHSRTSRWM